MKKVISLLLILIFIFIGSSCNKDETPLENEKEPTVVITPTKEEVETVIPTPSLGDEATPTITLEETEEVIYYQNPFEPLDYGLAYINLDKEVYSLEDDILVNIYNALNSDYVAIYDIDKEPGNGLPYKKTKVSDKTSITYSISDLGLESGEYAMYLYQNKSMLVFDRVTFKVSDGDLNDYQISSATFTASNENRIRTSSLTINTSSPKELTYSIYWAKDGKRLADYSYIAKKVIGNTDSFTLDFKQNMIMPNEANEIEVSILEGNSSSYFLKIDDTLKLEQSRYLYNFQVLTDIHVNNDLTRYSFWNSHFYNALLDIKCLSGNTSGIFTVGDNTDMGSSTHYDLMFDTIKKVFGNDVPNIYYAMGNHDYMYFSEEVGGMETAIDYFVERTKMEKNYYSLDLNGNKVIVLASEIKTVPGGITEEQVKWLKDELASTGKNEFVFIYLHQPLYNTVAGTLPGENSHGIDNVGDEIVEMLKEYPNAILFTGHTHYSMHGNNTAKFGNGLDANYVNNGAIAYLWSEIDRVGEVGGQCNFVEVYEDYIIIKARDILAREWISSAQFVVYLY